MPYLATDISREVIRLQNLWAPRKRAVQKWYDLIRLTDDQKKPDMESVIGNDPRTGYNMASWLLQPKTPTFVVDTEGMAEQDALSVAPVSDYCNRQYVMANRRTRSSLYGSFVKRLIDLMLVTGWYDVFSVPTSNGWVMEAWNPLSTYPEYDNQGQLVRVGRVYQLTSKAAKNKLAEQGWLDYNGNWSGNINVYNLWWMEDGLVWHCAAIGNHLAKPPTPYDWKRIPIYTGPVAGLPDDGGLSAGTDWRAEIGNSVVASIADIQKNYDRMMSYMQQIIRDVANPAYQEQVRGGVSVVTPEEITKRSAVFTYEPGEGLQAILKPSPPPELRTHEFDLRAQIQRGLFSDISFGNVAGGVSGFLMSQVTASAQQILHPFIQGVKSVLGEIATINIELMRQYEMGLGKNPFPKLPDNLSINFDYEVSIPGDFIQRITSARVANPNFVISSTTLNQVLFPEIKSSVLEHGRVVSEDASRNPIFQGVLVLSELRKAALAARDNNDQQFGDLLEKAAELMEAQMFQPQQATQLNQSVQGAPVPSGPPESGIRPFTEGVLQ